MPVSAADTRPSSPASPLADDVTAVVVASDPGPLRALLDQLAIGDVLPSRLIVATGESNDAIAPAVTGHHLRPRLHTVRVLRLKDDLPLRQAAMAAVDRAGDLVPSAGDSGPRNGFLWLLDERCRPLHGALAALLAEGRSSPTATLIAAKLRTTQRPPALLSVGYLVTRAGRWVPQPREGELDQGQYDDRGDVLATSSLGALVRLDDLREVGGWAGSYRSSSTDVAADVDLGWRVHRAGKRVLLVSQAVIDVDISTDTKTNAQSDTKAETDTNPETAATPEVLPGALTAASRRSLRSIALGAHPLLLWPLRIVSVLVTALLAATVMLLAKRPGAAAREIGEALSVLRLGLAWSAHRRFARAAKVPRRTLAQLFVPRDAARTATLDPLIPQRRGRGILTQQDLALRGSRPQAVVHPAFLAALAALALTLVAGRDLGGPLLRRIGSGVTGGEVIGSGASAASLWRSAVDSWGGAGLGAEAAWSPALALLAGMAWLGEHLPVVSAPAAPASATVAALLFLTMPLAALTMYAALALVTPRRSIRAFGGVSWAGTALAGDIVAEGRLGGGVVLVLAPLAAAAAARALSGRGRSYDAAQAGLLLALIGAFAPVVTGVAVAFTVAAGLVPRWSLRRALGIALVPAVVLAPLVRELVRDPQQALGGVGLFNWSGTTPTPWRLALLDVTPVSGTRLPSVLVEVLPYAAVPLLALALLGVMRSRERLVTLVAVVVAAVSLAGAILLGHLVVDTVPIGTAGAGAPVRPWAGSLLSIYALAVVVLAVRGLDVLARAALRHRSMRPASSAAGVLAVSTLLVAAGWSGFGTTLSTFVETRSEVALDQADGALAGRSLLIDRLSADQGAEAATAYRVLAAEGGMPVRTLPARLEVSDSLDAFVSRLDVGALEISGDDLPGGAAAVLARHAVGFVALTDAMPVEAVRALDAADGMRRLPDRGGLSWWRVDSTTSDVPSPARLVLRGVDGDGVSLASRHHARSDLQVPGPGTLEVAQTPAWSSLARVTLDGVPLAARADADTVSYEVPAAGRLTIDLPTSDRGLLLFSGAGLLLVAYLALPFGGLGSRPEDDRA